MAVSENTSGSQTATINTEHTLATITAAGTYQVAVDLSNMAGGDNVIIRVYVKVRTGDTSTIAMTSVHAHSQAFSPVLIMPPVPAPHEFKVTLEQTDGTGRAFPWAVYEY